MSTAAGGPTRPAGGFSRLLRLERGAAEWQ
jgi:hypothetical protein